jgi:hypothetical protein
MEFENLKIKCECSGKMEHIRTLWKGIEVRGWKCSKCHEEVLNPLDAQKALEMEKARKKNLLTVKLRKVGKSSVVTVPIFIMETENLRDGQKLEWKLEAGKMFLVAK